MKKAVLFIALFAATCSRLTAASWYLDSTSAGSNNGTNWANAWTATTNVVWGASGVKAGDTLFISGGPYTNNGITVGASGNSSNWIKIQVGNESGHSNKVQIKSISLGSGNQWIWINGAADLNMAPPYPGQIYTNRAALTNNIRLQLTHTDQGVTSQGLYVNGDSGANIRVEWVEFGPIASETDTDSWDGYGIRMLNLTTNGNWLVRACWFHDIRNDDINQNSVTVNPSGYDATIVEHCWLQGGGDDGVQWSRNGLTYRNNFADGHLLGFFHGHPDHLQFAGVSSRFLKVINNIMNGNANSIIKGEHQITEGGTVGDFIIAGNWFFQQANFPTNYDLGEPITIALWRANNSTNVVQGYMSNVYVLNNTSYLLPAGSGIPFNITRAVPGNDTNTTQTKSVWKVDVDNGWYANNIGIDLRYNSTSGSSWSWYGAGAGGGPSDTNGFFYTTNKVRWVNNVLAGTDKIFSYFGSAWTNGEALGMGNVSAMPSLISTNSRDLRLATNDTVAVGTGYNWSTLDNLTNSHPELMLDVFGNARFRSGVVDIGGASLLSSSGGSTNSSGPITNGLLVGINFDVAPSNDDAGYDDWSGNGNHGRHLGYMNAHTASNRAPDQINWTNRFTLTVETGGRFRRYPDGWDEYNNSGDYLGVTNSPSTNELWSMRTATILFWGRYDTPDASHPDYTNTWNAEGNRRFVGAGYGYPGAWTIGLPSDGGPRSAFRVYTDSSASSDKVGLFTDRVNISQGSPTIGSSTNMRFYVVTWTNGLAEGWLDGVLQFSKIFTNSAGNNVSNLTIRGPSGQRNGMLMIGGDTHNANPLLTYLTTNGVLRGDDGDGTFFEVTGAKQVPNHGWGGFCTMDDFRVYNRVLSTNELDSIMRKTEGSGSGGGGGGGGGGSTNSLPVAPRVSGSIAVGRNVSAGAIVGP
ncbi:MAG: hypothetical protein IT581_14055 [Verrucomicrobiales bacterium]|nr:hypothetical protein [Verrucomicrobiales bacterium]